MVSVTWAATHHGRTTRGQLRAAVFPAYDAQKPGNDEKAEKALRGDGDGGREDNRVQDLQRAVNSARRAEARVKKVLQEKEQRKQQWLQWEAELKKSFAREKGRYTAALTRLDNELKEAVRSQDAARAVVRQVASGEVEDSSLNDAMAMEFEQLVGAGTDPWEDWSQDAVLRRALEESVGPTGLTRSLAAPDLGNSTNLHTCLRELPL